MTEQSVQNIVKPKSNLTTNYLLVDTDSLTSLSIKFPLIFEMMSDDLTTSLTTFEIGS